MLVTCSSIDDKKIEKAQIKGLELVLLKHLALNQSQNIGWILSTYWLHSRIPRIPEHHENRSPATARNLEVLISTYLTPFNILDLFRWTDFVSMNWFLFDILTPFRYTGSLPVYWFCSKTSATFWSTKHKKRYGSKPKTMTGYGRGDGDGDGRSGGLVTRLYVRQFWCAWKLHLNASMRKSDGRQRYAKNPTRMRMV